MKSRIKLDVDYSNNPKIVLDVYYSDQPLDKILNNFINEVQSFSNGDVTRGFLINENYVDPYPCDSQEACGSSHTDSSYRGTFSFVPLKRRLDLINKETEFMLDELVDDDYFKGEIGLLRTNRNRLDKIAKVLKTFNYHDSDIDELIYENASKLDRLENTKPYQCDVEDKIDLTDASHSKYEEDKVISNIEKEEVLKSIQHIEGLLKMFKCNTDDIIKIDNFIKNLK